MGMKKILVIDYDQNSLANLCQVLSAEGYQVETAADGQSGWDKFNKEDPDLVLMEAMLPKVHGFELCQRITSERDSQTTVFIMTGVYKDRVYRTEALRTYGACEYFEKPLRMHELLAAIEKAIGKSSPQDVPRGGRRPEPADDEAPEPGYEFRYEPSPGEARAAAAEAGPRAAEPEAGPPARDDAKEPEAVALHKRDKPKSDDDIFTLPADLDRLSREIPKLRKPAAPRREEREEERFDALADELLRKAVSQPDPPKARIHPRPADGNGNGNGGGNGSVDVDQFLKSALADLDLKKEKVKVPKTAPLPPAPPAPPEKPRPTPPPPVAAKPRPAPQRLPDPPAPGPSILEKLAAEKAKPATPAKPEAALYPPVREKAAGPTLTPGDPGSDVSPFFMPPKPKPPAPPEVKPPAPKPIPPPARAEKRPEPARPAEPVRPVEPARTELPPRREAPKQEAARRDPEPAWREAELREPPRHETVRQEPARPEPRVVPGDIFQTIIEEAKPEKKGVSPIVVVVASLAVVGAVAGFFILKPKLAARKGGPALQPRQTVVRESFPPAPVTAAPAAEAASDPAPSKPEPKVEPKAKAKPKPSETKPSDGETSGVESVIPASTKAAVLPPASNPAGATRTGGSRTAAPAPAKPEPAPASAPDAASGQPAADPGAAQPPAGGNGAAAEADAPVVIPPPPAEPPVSEGALVDIATVTDLPKLVKEVQPVYPAAAQRLGIEGTITVNALIDEKGSVIDTAIIKGVQGDKGLGKAAETAVKKWKFEPARRDGVAVKVWRPFAISFKVPK